MALISLIAVHSGALESTLKFSVTKASLRIEESDGSVARDVPLAPYALLQDQLRLENSQTLKVAFNAETDAGDAFRPQQAFLHAYCPGHEQPALSVATRNKDGSLSAALKAAIIREQLGLQSSTCRLELVLGDSRSHDGVQWALGDLTIPPPPKGESTVDSEPDPFDVKPEIVHQHRPPSKRVPGVIALAGAALCMAPLAYCGVLLLGMKANLKGFPSGPAALWNLLFQAGLASILALYLLFWLRLNLMQTVPAAALLGLATAGVGTKALSGLAASRGKQE